MTCRHVDISRQHYCIVSCDIWYVSSLCIQQEVIVVWSSQSSSAAVNGQVPTVSVLPEVLWGTGGGAVTRNIVETAVIQLYCSGSGATIEEITWSKDGTTLTNDPPHLRIRGSSIDMSILTIDNFNSSDDGQYVCHVTGSTGSNTSSILTLTGMYIDGSVGYQWWKPVMHSRKFLTHPPAMFYFSRASL